MIANGLQIYVLNEKQRRWRVSLFCQRISLLGLLLFLWRPQTYAAEGPCVVELPVYDAFGNRLDFKVTRVQPEGRDINLLTVKVPGKGVTSKAEKISFPDSSILTRALVVTLEESTGRRVSQPLVVVQCPQRVSIRFGESQTDVDVWRTLIRGHAVGCNFAGDWWIRAMPMFGKPAYPAPLDGYLGTDGYFEVPIMAGERHIVVIGKNKQPVKAVGVDVAVGKGKDLGTVSLSGSCPE